MSTADTSDVFTISAPINRDDEGVVLGEFSQKFIVVGGIIDVDVVIVRTNSQSVSAWAVLQAFNPFLRVFVSGNNLVKLAQTSSDGEGTIIVTNGDVAEFLANGNSSSTLGVW